MANREGGVGKSAAVFNLALPLADSGRKVLVVALDPKGNATSGIATPEDVSASRREGKTIYQALVGGLPIAEILRQVRPTLWLGPAGGALGGAESGVVGVGGAARRVRRLPWPMT